MPISETEDEPSAWVGPTGATLVYARITGRACSARTVINHDEELQPLRSESGRRLYAVAAVEAWARRRAEKDRHA